MIKFLMSKEAFLPLFAFGLIVLASNILVQYPVTFFGLQEYLTYGAFSYPVAFLVTDLSNRRFGASKTRALVGVGFLIAVILSVIFATPRIALASGTAFLVANLIDVQIFERLRHKAWWMPPLGSSLVSSALDTMLFFSIAFYGVDFMSTSVDVFGSMQPLWVKLAVFDFFVKLAIAALMIVPYGALIKAVRPIPQA